MKLVKVGKVPTVDLNSTVKAHLREIIDTLNKEIISDIVSSSGPVSFNTSRKGMQTESKWLRAIEGETAEEFSERTIGELLAELRLLNRLGAQINFSYGPVISLCMESADDADRDTFYDISLSYEYYITKSQGDSL